ncbi:S41 family peptidase [Phocaeicola salanitronis]|uniref:S41 family peptidase n=1 Tax=Phocaeicola salanitronis TaxID=376805 RepID=UPI0025A39604|nr:S41 family peptidase [Phocaeicola salanitronis]MDM8305340.1 S41 family peptidase [Phocaeicola salanitronis]
MDNTFPIPILYKEKAGNPYQHEVMNLLAFIKAFHPLPLVDEVAFARFEKYAESLCDKLDERMERPAFQVELNRWLALLQDAHTFVMLDDTSLYPFTLRYYEESFYFRSLPDSVPDCMGKELIAMNGRAVDSLIQELMVYVPSENQVKACITGSFFMNHKAFLNALGIDTDRDIRFMFADGDEVRLPSSLDKGAAGSHQVKQVLHPVTARRNKPFHYQITGDTCYFQFNAMIDRFSYWQGCRLMQVSPDKAVADNLPLFADFLDEMACAMAVHNVNRLVIDMRYNGGGNSVLGDVLLEFLGVSLQDIRPFRSYIRVSDFLQTYYPALFIRDKYESMRGKLVEQNQVMNDLAADMPKPSSRFHGEVTFIQGQNTFSSANYLLTLVKDNALFPIIGTPTSQSPTCFGDVLCVELPYTQTKGYISHSYFVRPDERNQETSLLPDSLIRTSLKDWLNGKDACWD